MRDKYVDLVADGHKKEIQVRQESWSMEHLIEQTRGQPPEVVENLIQRYMDAISQPTVCGEIIQSWLADPEYIVWKSRR